MARAGRVSGAGLAGARTWAARPRSTRSPKGFLPPTPNPRQSHTPSGAVMPVVPNPGEPSCQRVLSQSGDTELLLSGGCWPRATSFCFTQLPVVHPIPTRLGRHLGAKGARTPDCFSAAASAELGDEASPPVTPAPQQARQGVRTGTCRAQVSALQRRLCVWCSQGGRTALPR